MINLEEKSVNVIKQISKNCDANHRSHMLLYWSVPPKKYIECDVNDIIYTISKKKYTELAISPRTL